MTHSGTARRRVSVYNGGEITRANCGDSIGWRGSASIALEIKPTFDKFVHQQNARYAPKLLISVTGTLLVTFQHNDDANRAIAQLLIDTDCRPLGVLFLTNGRGFDGLRLKLLLEGRKGD